jgi:hypothetical protein
MKTFLIWYENHSIDYFIYHLKKKKRNQKKIYFRLLKRNNIYKKIYIHFFHLSIIEIIIILNIFKFSKINIKFKNLKNVFII